MSRRVDESRRFRLTFKCLDLGYNAIARSELRSLARPLLRGIVGEHIEAASIGVLDGFEVVYVERIQAGLERLAVDVRIGNRVPAYSSALGPGDSFPTAGGNTARYPQGQSAARADVPDAGRHRAAFSNSPPRRRSAGTPYRTRKQ